MSDPEPIEPESEPPLPALSAKRRLAAMTLAWGSFVLASPGLLAPAGVTPLAVVALAFWTAAAVRPGHRAFLVEWLAASVALGGLMHWLAYISPFVVPPAGIGMGLYMAAGGALARALARRLPATAAGALAWVSLETLRDLVEPPFGMGWLRLAHCASDFGPLLDTARTWGPAGVSFVLAGLGAGLGGAWVTWVAARRGGGRSGAGVLLALGLGVCPALVGLLLGVVVAAPQTEVGPTVLAVQPNVSQARKQAERDPQSIMREQILLSRSGQLDDPVDLVVWSETMVRFEIASSEAVEAAAGGAQFDPWHAWRGTPREWFDQLALIESTWVRKAVFGDGIGGFAGGAALREGTAFLGGIEEWRAVDGRLRRFNVGCLWSPDGERATAAKTHLVPLGETTLGFERFRIVRDWIQALAGYTPDFESAPPSAVAFADRDGRAWRVGVPICFDNAFVDSFPGDVDFHVVLSNEAWYRRSIELDQMIAFTRLSAAASGRSVVRCTNSGISALVGPDGRELQRLTVDGDDREVSGALRVEVPVPSDPSASTPFAAFRALWRSGWVLVGILPLLLPRRRRDLSRSSA